MEVSGMVFVQQPHGAYDEESEIFDDELPDGTVLSHKEMRHVQGITAKDLVEQLDAILAYFKQKCQEC